MKSSIGSLKDSFACPSEKVAVRGAEVYSLYISPRCAGAEDSNELV